MLGNSAEETRSFFEPPHHAITAVMRKISAIVFDVTIESGELTGVEVMHRVFAQSPGIHLRSMSPLTYQSGNYEQTLSSPEVWTGRLERIRTGPVSTVVQAADGSFHFIDQQMAVPTSHATTYYAFVPAARILVYRDTAEMPHTRLASYVTGAVHRAVEAGFLAHCEVTPRKSTKPLKEWIQRFTTIERVRVNFRHSRSPGNRAVDSILEQLEAESATEIVRAPQDGSLNKSTLLSPTLPIGQAIDHLDQASQNGEAEISGRFGDESIKFNTTHPVERHIIDVEEDVSQMRSSLAWFAAKLMAIGTKT